MDAGSGERDDEADETGEEESEHECGDREREAEGENRCEPLPNTSRVLAPNEGVWTATGTHTCADESGSEGDDDGESDEE
mmetsp:Transcript_51510/g.129234  ORF Transcript_51510/g.129234 Transcript_51510/m.129234 type:complete len:80 (-) Transcript_51510:90-329(-)